MLTNFVSQKLLKVCPSKFMFLKFGNLSNVTAKFDKLYFDMTLSLDLHLSMPQQVKNNPTAYELPYFFALPNFPFDYNPKLYTYPKYSKH